MVQCQCIKSDGKQCTRDASTKKADNPLFCWQHQKCTKLATGVNKSQKIEKQKMEKQKMEKQDSGKQKMEQLKAQESSGMIPEDTNVYLVGDSVLDNFIWLKNPQQNLTQQLKAKTKNQNNIFNFAVDETETDDILKGKTPGHHYQEGRLKYKLENYPVSADGKVYPIELIKKNKNPSKKNVAVLSVGGNDARVCLYCLAQGWQGVYNKMEEKGFSKNYAEIVKSLIDATGNVILVLVYKPYKDFFPQYHSEFDKLLDVVRKMLLAQARVFKIPIIDLSKTFDPNDPTHYGEGNGTSPIEPSNKSSQFIADLIAAVINDFKFGTDSSKIYYGRGTITIEPNV